MMRAGVSKCLRPIGLKAIAAVALGLALPAAGRAAPIDPFPREEVYLPEQCFRLIGTDRDRAARAALAVYPQDELVETASAIVVASSEPAEVLGAAVFLAETDAGAADGARAALRLRLDAANDPLPRPALVEALGAVGGPGEIGILSGFVRDGDDALVQAANRGLCRIGGPAGIECVLAAARALEATPGKRLSDAQEALRWAARRGRGADIAEALGRFLPSAEMLSLLQDAGPEAWDAVGAVARRALDRGEAAVRMKAIELLAATRAQSAGEAIVAALSDSSPDVRRSAAEACGRLDLGAAVPGLAALLDDPATRGVAHAALIQLTGRHLPPQARYWARPARPEANGPETLAARPTATARARAFLGLWLERLPNRGAELPAILALAGSILVIAGLVLGATACRPASTLPALEHAALSSLVDAVEPVALVSEATVPAPAPSVSAAGAAAMDPATAAPSELNRQTGQLIVKRLQRAA